MSKSQDLKNQTSKTTGPCKNLTKSGISVKLIAKKLKYVTQNKTEFYLSQN